jgi:hypothetical protein
MLKVDSGGDIYKTILLLKPDNSVKLSLGNDNNETYIKYRSSLF